MGGYTPGYIGRLYTRVYHGEHSTPWVYHGGHSTHPGYTTTYTPWVYHQLPPLRVHEQQRGASRCVPGEEALCSTLRLIKGKEASARLRASLPVTVLQPLCAELFRSSRCEKREDWIAGRETSVNPLCERHSAHSPPSDQHLLHTVCTPSAHRQHCPSPGPWPPNLHILDIPD